MTPTQRRILWLMREHDQEFVTGTGHDARVLGFGHGFAEEGGLIVRAYSTPWYFMATTSGTARPEPWLVPVERNARGRWYQLTEAGRRAAESIGEEPPVPERNKRSTFGRASGRAYF